MKTENYEQIIIKVYHVKSFIIFVCIYVINIQ